jgi:DNA-directed RNA polymerase subunit K/omega
MLPVYEIIDFDENRYILSRAVMKRARQINFLGDDELEGFEGKVVSLALKQILTSDLKYDYARPQQQE